MRRCIKSCLLKVCPSVILASSVFFFCTSNRRASIEFSMINLTVVTGLVWPRRCCTRQGCQARARFMKTSRNHALCGPPPDSQPQDSWIKPSQTRRGLNVHGSLYQYGSMRYTRCAAVRFSPTPPALRLTRRTSQPGSFFKASMARLRSSRFIVPSRRS
jgi:hypothetical protein